MRGKTRVQAPKYFGPKPLMVASDKTPVSAARSAGSTRLRGRDGELCSRHVESADICPLSLPPEITLANIRPLAWFTADMN